MPDASDPEERVVLHEEQADVTRQTRPTGRVSVSTVTKTRAELIDALLTRENAEIERVLIGQPVDEIPVIREEGDTIVIPLVQEVVVVERRLILKEEIRIRRVTTTERHLQTVTLREQDAVITRGPAQTASTNDGIPEDKPSGSA